MQGTSKRASVIKVVDVQVLKAYYHGQPLVVLPSQDVWSLGVMVLALLSPTPITAQQTGIPACDAAGRCKRAFQVTWVYQNLEMLALEQAGITLGHGDQTMDQVTRQLLAVLRRCLSGDPAMRPGLDELKQELLGLQLTCQVRSYHGTSTLFVAASHFLSATSASEHVQCCVNVVRPLAALEANDFFSCAGCRRIPCTCRCRKCCGDEPDGCLG
jgi:hypothetical protein